MGGDWTKSKTQGLKGRQFSRTVKGRENNDDDDDNDKYTKHAMHNTISHHLVMGCCPRQQSQISGIPASRPTPIYLLSTTSMIWNISIGQPGLAAWLCSVPAPAPLLISRSWETGKSP